MIPNAVASVTGVQQDDSDLYAGFDEPVHPALDTRVSLGQSSVLLS